MALRGAPGGDQSLESSERVPLDAVIRELSAIVGTAPAPLPARPTEEDIVRAQRALTDDHRFSTFSEQFRNNELLSLRHSLQRTKVWKAHPTPEQAAELSAVREAQTFYEYVPDILRGLAKQVESYHRLRSSLSIESAIMHDKEVQTALYLQELIGTLRERVRFANVILLDAKIRENHPDSERLVQLWEQERASTDLTAEDRRALEGGDTARWAVGNALNQRVIDLLATPSTAQGVQEGFQPQEMVIDLVLEDFRQTLEKEKQIARDPTLGTQIARMQTLEERSANEALTPEERGEHAALQASMAHTRDEQLDALNTHRAELMTLLMEGTLSLADGQFRRAKLTTIQHQFGESFAFEGVSSPNPDTTPAAVRRAMADHMNMRKTFHLERMAAFGDAIDGTVLATGLAEVVEHVSNHAFRKVLSLSASLWSTIFTLPVPEALGLKERAKSALREPFETALGWPAGKQTDADLTPEERQRIEAKAQSILDAVRAFDRTTLARFQETLGLIQSLPSATTAVGQDVAKPLPAMPRITTETVQTTIDAHGLPTTATVLFRQLDVEFGISDPTTGVLGEYGRFLTTTNAIIGTHIDVGGALHDLSRRYIDLMWYLLAALGVGVAAGAVGTYALLKATGKVVRTAGRAGKGAVKLGARGAKEVVDAGIDVAQRLLDEQEVETKERVQEVLEGDGQNPLVDGKKLEGLAEDADEQPEER